MGTSTIEQMTDIAFDRANVGKCAACPFNPCNTLNNPFHLFVFHFEQRAYVLLIFGMMCVTHVKTIFQ